MTEGYNTKNYFAQCGSEFVVGGKLTLLPGAIVEDTSGVLGGVSGGASSVIPAMNDSMATTVAALKENFNALLAGLRTAGLMAAAAMEQPEVSPDDETDGGDATEASGDTAEGGGTEMPAGGAG